MEIYSDGSTIEEIENLILKNGITGFTTNPSLMRKIGVSDYKKYCKDFLLNSQNLPVSFEVFADDLEEMKITGDRQYDHNAIIVDYDQPVKISGPILENNEKYEFVIELRTMYDTSNWIFSLNDFHAEVIP